MNVNDNNNCVSLKHRKYNGTRFLWGKNNLREEVSDNNMIKNCHQNPAQYMAILSKHANSCQIYLTFVNGKWMWNRDRDTKNMFSNSQIINWSLAIAQWSVVLPNQYFCEQLRI